MCRTRPQENDIGRADTDYFEGQANRRDKAYLSRIVVIGWKEANDRIVLGERQRGVFMLRSYPDKASLEMLMSLLKDEGAYRWNMSSNTSCATYMVRAAAYDVLRDRGDLMPKPLLDDCHSQ
jgi:hypothetical protein